MPQCKHFDVCGLEGEAVGEDGCCVLHSPDLEKDQADFNEALKQHQEAKGHNYRHVVFVGRADFKGVEFEGEADFFSAMFSDQADFTFATFSSRIFFTLARFSEQTDFISVTFGQGASFRGATFSERASFGSATFSKRTDFTGAVFDKGVSFHLAKFSEWVGFYGTSFLGYTLFAGPAPDEWLMLSLKPIFEDIEVDFRQVTLEPLNCVTFRNADLRGLRLLDTDIRNIEFTSVLWPDKEGGTYLYDELYYNEQQDIAYYRRGAAYEAPKVQRAILAQERTRVPWGKLKRLYRQLKQNHEEQKDYAAGGNFHYREKEMQRLSPNCSQRRWLLLSVYKVLGGYGERVTHPLVSFIILSACCTVLYMMLTMHPADAMLHSLQVSFLFRPDAPEWIGRWGLFVQIVQTILSPLLLGLLALSIRQRVKR